MHPFWKKIYDAHQACPTCPSPADVAAFFTNLLGTLFPDFSRLMFPTADAFETHRQKLMDQLDNILQYHPEKGSVTSQDFFEAIPHIFEKISQDVGAMYEGDPAAKSVSEVIRTYPGFYAIAAYRVAHQLHVMGVSGIPRMITEHAHSRTGIDIHPAARIGRHFCIDHGTGLVIGETAVIGDHVKLYQGVTLGALSVSKEDAEKKRHPTIEDYVVIYAGATILGGETVIGHHSVIGGNVWLTRSVPPHSRLYYQAAMNNAETGQSDVVVFRSGAKS